MLHDMNEKWKLFLQTNPLNGSSAFMDFVTHMEFLDMEWINEEEQMYQVLIYYKKNFYVLTSSDYLNRIFIVNKEEFFKNELQLLANNTLSAAEVKKLFDVLLQKFHLTHHILEKENYDEEIYISELQQNVVGTTIRAFFMKEQRLYLRLSNGMEIPIQREGLVPRKSTLEVLWNHAEKLRH